ncbi:hypothetical protein JHK87_049229 [Glycine soja]|nr:hypothetical protein JHK87_049229 [Glycine soja]
MATFNNLCLMVVVSMVITALLVKTGHSYEDQSSEEAVPPMTDVEEHLVACIMKLQRPCDELYVFGTIFFGNKRISKDCCTNIHDMGKPCHDALTTYFIGLPKFEAKRTQILERSNQVWKQCNNTSAQLDHEVPNNNLASDAGYVPTDPPVSPSYEKYLRDCAAKLHPHCGDQFYAGIFYGRGTISKDCCKNVVTDVGKTCYDNMTKYVLGSPQFKENEAQIMNRSNQIWNDCTLD